MAARVKGTVKWFNGTKGFGFISPEDGGEDLFVHQSAIKSDGFRTLSEGDPVEFTVASGDDGRTKAVDVTAPGGGAISSGGSRGGSGGGRGGRHGGVAGGYGGGGYGAGGGGYGGAGGGRACYTCGETGHMARDCSQGGGVYGGGGYGGGGGGGGGGCFNCGESGHFARDCPKKSGY